ncbi:ABC transporter substrate-binding protein [Mesorhizobium loti]|uniref:ABC transporter substrate-binding protein n=1 Tax=Rhizobium loti TaxID=381 RepID=UPI00047CE27B|nr:ABC transporter substrate-binding protein [Mesorhizobium loti]
MLAFNLSTRCLAIAFGSAALCLSGGLVASATEFDSATIAIDKTLAAKVPAAIASRGVLTVGSDTTYPPAEFLGGADGMTPMGIDVDLAEAIARTLGLRLSFVTAQFDSILPAIGPKYDLGISAFTITKARYGAVDFVSYFNAGKQWAVQAGNPSHFDPANPCGAKVGVQVASTSEKLVIGLSDKCIAAGKPAISLVALSKQTDIITRLVNGAVDATMNGSTNIGYAVKQTEGKLQTLGGISEPSPNGIAIAKGNTEWATLIADTLNKLIADGTYARVLSAWGSDSAAVAKAEVNPVVPEE